MANWAIMVGVNKYWKPQLNLKGAVADALRMTRWLLQAKECHVPPENIFLLTSPAPDVVPAGVNHLEATADNLLGTIPKLIEQSGGTGERLFFYFSGHGITNYEGFKDEQALLMTDFTEVLTNKAIKLDSIQEYFKATGFREQFFFIDACRNVLQWSYDFETAATTVKLKTSVTQTPVDQFIFLSTAPRSKSWEGLLSPGDAPGEEQGAFTGALLAGLQGAGSAKVYDGEQDEYLVRAEDLFSYVEAEILKREIYVIKDPAHPVIQRPRLDGERGSNNPVLARIPVDTIKPELLELYVEPESVWDVTEVSIASETGEFDETIKPVVGAPVLLSPLRPMKYTVRVSAPNHSTEKKRWSFELYEPLKLNIRLLPQQSDVAPPTMTSATARPRGFVAMNGEDVGDDFARDAAGDVQPLPDTEGASSTQLILTASDPLAPLEVSDSIGTLLRAEQGRIELAGVKPGFYRARLVTPEGEFVEELIELSAGESEAVQLSAPPPPKTHVMNEVMEKAHFLIAADNTLDVSKTVGPIASARLSTVLALAADAANRDHSCGRRLKDLGLASFRDMTSSDATCGLQIVAGVEFGTAEEARDYLTQVRVRFWAHGESLPRAPQPLVAVAGVPGVAEFAQAAPPGTHRLLIETAGHPPTIFSVTTLTGRLTMMVFHRSDDERMRVYQYMPSLAPEVNAQPDGVRRLELIQRFYLSGRLENAFQLTKDSLYIERNDPLAYCLGGYLALKLMREAELRKAVDNLMQLYDRVTDAYVLQGERYTLERNDAAAARSYGAALERGLPIFAEGTMRLLEGVRRHGVEHPLIARLEQVSRRMVKGVLWSAWTPEPSEILKADS